MLDPTSATAPLQLIDREPPSSGQAIVVAPGVRWVRIPMPGALDHVNVWLIDHADGCVLVDTGIKAPVAQEAWQLLEAQVLADKPLRGVFLTHVHPDHVGLARWLQERHRVPVWASRRTHEQLQVLSDRAEMERGAPEGERFLIAHGVSDREQLNAVSPTRFGDATSGLPEIVQHAADGDRLVWGGRTFQVLETNGHAEGHLCLYAPELGVLISGDQVLPTISSNIGLGWRSQDKNPLRSYLTSLERLHTLPTDTLTLPSHGLPFRGLQRRIDRLHSHHITQLELVERACATSKTAADLLPLMFRRKLEGIHVLLAMGEALAHLEYLVAQGRLQRVTDAAGHVRYSATV